MPLTKGISGAGTSSAPPITSVAPPLAPAARPAPSGPSAPAGAPVPPPTGWRDKAKLRLRQQWSKVRAAYDAHKAEEAKKSGLIWFAVSVVLMVVTTFLLSLWLTPRLAGGSFHLPETVGGITPPAGWPVMGGILGVIVGIVTLVGGVIVMRMGKSRLAKVAGVVLLIAGALVFLQSVHALNYGGIWLAFVGLLAMAVGLIMMGRKADRLAWMSFGVLVIWLSVVLLILPALGIFSSLPIRLALWLAALWAIVKFAWVIGQRRAKQKLAAATATPTTAPPATGTAAAPPEKKGFLAPFLAGVALATLLVSLPLAATGNLGTPSLNHPGAVTKLDKVCGNGDAQACANVEVDKASKYTGLLQKIEALCSQDVNKDKPQCSNLSDDRKAYDNPNSTTPGIKQIRCEQFKRLDVAARCADLPKLPKSQ